MSFKKFNLGLLLFLFTLISLNAQENFVHTDSISSFINFDINSLDIHGTISGIDTHIIIDKDNLDESSIKGSATVRTINTGNLVRDKKFLGKKYLNEKAFPTITFESTHIQKMEENVYMVEGNLTIRDITEKIYIEMYFQLDRVLGVSYFNTIDYDLYIKGEQNRKVDFFLELFHPGAE